MKIMKNVSYLLLFFMFLMSSSCNIFKGGDKTPPIDPQGVYGKVTDYKTTKLLEKVTVTLKNAIGDKNTFETQSDGSYNFKNVVHGDYTVYAEKNGYILQSKSVTVEGGGNGKGVSFELKPVYEITPNDGLELGATANSKRFDIINNLEQALGFKIINNNKSWFAVEPLEGNVSPNGNSLPINITVNRNGLPSGDHKGSITINFDNIPGRTYQIGFDVPNNEAPSVTSDKPTSITPTTAQIGGSVTSIGKSTVLNHGHVWGTKRNPECCVPGFYTSLGSRGLGAFVSTLTGLKPGETYYVRSYATNEKGINYSYNQEYEFTTPVNPTEPSVSIVSASATASTTAKVVGRINDNGGSKISVYGFVWSKDNPNPDPEVEKTKIEFNGEPSNQEFTGNLSNLDPGKSYYVVAYAKNSSNSKYAKSAANTFNTPAPVVEPKLTTSAATDIDYTFATMKGNITDLGSVKIVEHGFVYSKSNADPKINAKNCAFKNLGNLNATTPISDRVTGLLKGMSYYYRTYVKTEEGMYYYSSAIRVFATKEDNLIYYWTFNSDLSDFSGNSNHAQFGLGTVKSANDRFGNPEKSMDITSGTIHENQYSKVNITNELTVSFWVKLSDGNFTGSPRIIYGHSDRSCISWGQFSGFYLYLDPNRVEGKNNILFYIRDDSEPIIKSVISKDDIDSQKWQNITIVKSGKAWKFYVDGDLTTTENFNIDFRYVGENISFLNYVWNCSQDGYGNTNALVDDVRRYNRALKDTEVLELYNREK